MEDGDDLKQLMQRNYLEYASYVILDRAIPNAVDGLKPVQRRILHTLYKMDDGRLHKVANVAGQTMALHPHGDAPIAEALIHMATRDFLLDKQGNFGNLYTGDPAAAARYIETRLTPLSRETLFNPDLTPTVPSYDGRHEEPTVLPAKIPVLLLQGAEGIAVGMSTRILPHNFNECIDAQIAFLEKEPFSLLPDFQQGGIMDASEYDKGRGRVRLRAKVKVRDDKTLVIEQICYGTTTESLCRSIDEAAKKGKIKIDSINDYTSEKVEIEIKLPRGQHAEEVIEELYAFTECEVSLNCICLVIHEGMPLETSVDELLRLATEKLVSYLKRELEIEKARLLEKIFEKTLEQIFIENRLYKKIEEIKSQEKIDSTVEASLVPYLDQLSRVPQKEDRERLLAIPIRRISRFDIEKNQQEITEINLRIDAIEKELKNITRTTINYLKKLKERYGKLYPRRTAIKVIAKVDVRAMETKPVSVALDEGGFIGTKVKSEVALTCTNYDKLLILFKDGTYTVLNIPEKRFLGEGKRVVHMGVADKQTLFRAVYKDPKSGQLFAKRFVVDSFLLDRSYDFLPEGMQLELLTTEAKVEIEMHFAPMPRQKSNKATFDLDSILVKGVKAKGVRLSPKKVRKVTIKGSPPEQLTLW